MTSPAERISFLNLVLEIALATSIQNRNNFHHIEITSAGEVYATFEWYSHGSRELESVLVTQEEIEMGAEEAGRIWREKYKKYLELKDKNNHREQ